MLKYSLFTVLFTFLYHSENLTEYIQKNAVKIHSLNNLDENIWLQVAPYKAIWVGEMHGTNEPALFVEGLVGLFEKHHKKVILGLEIPADKMGPFLHKPTKSKLKKSWFFKNGYDDGRNSSAWAELILKFRKNKNIELLFFDILEDMNAYNRDSIMAVNIDQKLKASPEAVFIGLSGNIHGKIIPFRNKLTAGCYLYELENAGLRKEDILSIIHFYDSGTMANNQSDGYKIREVNNPSIFGKAVDYDVYFLPVPEYIEQFGANGILFTRKVSGAEKWPH